MITDKFFWMAVAERALKTFAQFFAAASLVAWGDLTKVASGAAFAAILSIFTSIASVKVGLAEGPSLTTEGVVDQVVAS
jgi:hypothetical protein